MEQSPGGFAVGTPLPDSAGLLGIFCINVEEVLAWPALGLETSVSTGRARLMALLRAGRPDKGPRLMTGSDVDADDAATLFQRFLNRFHIYNPVLEVERVNEAVRFTSFNGLGWDAKSCLLVNSPPQAGVLSKARA